MSTNVRSPLFALVLFFGCVSQPGQAASNDLFGGDFGRWLQAEALPELSRLVGKHPRFRGEQIRVVTMEGGRPALDDNELTAAVRDQLTHRLTRVNGVQIAWQTAPVRCGVPRKIPYLLGVEVSGESRMRSLVTIALVDVEEGVWVSGGYLQWRGALTQQERRALVRSVAAVPTGSIEHPLPGGRHKEITATLLENIECSLRGGLEGGVQVVAADPADGLLTSVAAQLREALTRSASLVLVERSPRADKQGAVAADWVLELSTSRDVGEAVVATLTPTDGGRGQLERQRLAAVYVHRSEPTRLATTRPEERTTGRPQQSTRVSATPTAPVALIDELHEVPAKEGDVCYRRSAACLELQFELTAPSYLLVLRTAPSGALNLGSCSNPRKSEGTKRYRLQLRETGVGFYAVATTDLALARRLHRQLAAGASNCGDRSRSDWLTQFETALASAQEQVDWHAFRVPARRQGESYEPEALAANHRVVRPAADFSRENER